jgi:lipopolysaccharide export system protein LptC
MKISKKKIFLILIILAIIGAGIFYFFHQKNKKAEGVERQGETGVIQTIERSEAIEIATDFMEKQDFKNEYDLSSTKLDHFPDAWNVWFDKKDKNQKPNKGLVRIDKQTKEAKWMPLQ